MTRFAIAGFRHGHVLSLVSSLRDRSDTECVAACEEDEATRSALADGGKVTITHDSFRPMLAEADFDVLGVGDYFARRGALAIAGLEAGKHVLVDKPLCTSLQELERIRELAAERGLAVGCMLSLRDNGAVNALREAIAADHIGAVQTMSLSGQHPLLLGGRPGWYFEPGRHGGAINDIGVHAVDLIGWLTGREIVEVVAARAWNAKAKASPHFKGAGQFMLKLDNDGGVLCDVSYLAPDKMGYAAPQYWRITCHGERGVLETSCGSKNVRMIRDSDNEEVLIPVSATQSHQYLESFLHELRGETEKAALTTGRVLHVSRIALLAQEAADSGMVNVPVRGW